MCIIATVGQGGTNSRPDVRCIQLLLNLDHAACGLSQDMVVDGLCGKGTITALQAYQTSIGGKADGVVAPGDATLAAMRRKVAQGLTRATFWGTMAGANQALIDRYWGTVSACLDRNGINTPLRMAHFLAQVGHECADLLYPEELADGSAYEGRKDLGNTEPGDGPRFKGRGLIQLTGRANYTRYSDDRKRDFVTGDNPKLIASDPELAVDAAGWFWSTNNLNPLADKDDVTAITRRINGGTNGLQDRVNRLARAKWFLLA